MMIHWKKTLSATILAIAIIGCGDTEPEPTTEQGAIDEAAAKVREVGADVSQDIAKVKADAKDEIAEIKADADKKIDNLQQDGQEEMKEIAENTQEKVNDLKQDVRDAGEQARDLLGEKAPASTQPIMNK